MTRKTKTYSAENPFRFRVAMTNGRSAELDPKRTVKRLSYPKHPDDWTGADLVKVIRQMLAAAHKARGVKPTRGIPTLWIDARDGFMEIHASQNLDVWAVVPPQFNIRQAAIAALIAETHSITSVHAWLPTVLPRDRKTQQRENQKMAKLLKRVQADIEAEERKAG